MVHLFPSKAVNESNRISTNRLRLFLVRVGYFATRERARDSKKSLPNKKIRRRRSKGRTASNRPPRLKPSKTQLLFVVSYITPSNDRRSGRNFNLCTLGSAWHSRQSGLFRRRSAPKLMRRRKTGFRVSEQRKTRFLTCVPFLLS